MPRPCLVVRGGAAATALLGSPRAVPTGWFQRAVAAACWVRAVPALAGIGWLTAATGGADGGRCCHAPRYPAAVRRWAATAMGAVLGVSGLLEAVAARGSAVEPLLALSVAGCGAAVVGVCPALGL